MTKYVVFDGYERDCSKPSDGNRRSQKKASNEMMFHQEMHLIIGEKCFFLLAKILADLLVC